MSIDWRGLTLQSLQTPADAAAEIMSWNLNRDTLWSALVLMAIINTGLVLLVVQVSGSAMPLPGYFYSPLTLFVLIAGMMVVYIHAMYWAALAMGGQGRLNDVLAVVTWFQVLRAGAQLAIFITSLAIPALGMLLSLVVLIWGVWIFLSFLAQAAGLNSPLHALAVLVISGVGMILGLGILFSLIGVAAQGT